MSCDIFNLKAGDICKYTIEGVERYMIIMKCCCSSEENLSKYLTVWKILKGFKMTDVKHLEDLNERHNVDYSSVDYARVHGDLYFPIGNGDYVEMRHLSMFKNDKVKTSIEVIDHLSDVRLQLIPMIHLTKSVENATHGKICDIDTMDISGIESDLKDYIECEKFKEEYKEHHGEEGTKYTLENSVEANSKIREYDKSIPTWIDSKFGKEIPVPVPIEETFDPNRDYDVKDIRDFEAGALYEYLDAPIEKGGEIKYTFIKSNPYRDMTDEELEKIKDDVIVFACDAEMFRDEGIFREKDMFRKFDHSKFVELNDYGWFRIMNRFYVPSCGIQNWVWSGKENFAEKMEVCRPKLIAKISPSQLKLTNIAASYVLHDRAIDIDLIDTSVLDTELERIQKLERTILDSKRKIKKYSSNIMKKVFQGECVEEQEKGPVCSTRRLIDMIKK